MTLDVEVAVRDRLAEGRIGVTPEMVDAGVAAYEQFNEACVTDQLVTLVYSAMDALKPARMYPGCHVVPPQSESDESR